MYTNYCIERHFPPFLQSIAAAACVLKILLSPSLAFHHPTQRIAQVDSCLHRYHPTHCVQNQRFFTRTISTISNMSTNKALENFNFLGLSVDLRVECYKHIARDSRRLTHDERGIRLTTYMSLQQSCRQISDEAAPYQPPVIELMITVLVPFMSSRLINALTSVLHSVETLSIDMGTEESRLFYGGVYSPSLRRALPHLRQAKIYVVLRNLDRDYSGTTALDICDSVTIKKLLPTYRLVQRYFGVPNDSPRGGTLREQWEAFDRKFTTTAYAHSVGLRSCRVCLDVTFLVGEA